MNPTRIARLAAGLAIAGLLAWSLVLAYRFGADGVRLETAQQAMERVKQAQEETRVMQEKAHAAQENYTQAQAGIAERDRRIRGLVDRMRDTPSADDLAQHSVGAVSRYAAETDRDFAECRAEFAEMGRTAAGAAAAAHALKDAWPKD